MITRDEVYEAFDDALALAREMDGAGIESKLAIFGLPFEDVRELLEERWAEHKAEVDPERPHLLFVQGFAEGLMLGVKLAERRQRTHGWGE